MPDFVQAATDSQHTSNHAPLARVYRRVMTDLGYRISFVSPCLKLLMRRPYKPSNSVFLSLQKLPNKVNASLAQKPHDTQRAPIASDYRLVHTIGTLHQSSADKCLICRLTRQILLRLFRTLQMYREPPPGTAPTRRTDLLSCNPWASTCLFVQFWT